MIHVLIRVLTSVTPIISPHNLGAYHKRNHKNPSNPTKNSLILTGESASKEHWEICYGTLLNDFIEIDARLGDLLFYGFAVADHILHRVRDSTFFGRLLKKKRELGGTIQVRS